MTNMQAKVKSAGGYYELLRSRGLRPTYARLAIIEALEKSAQTHMTADQVYLELSRQNHAMPLSSIYRCLNSMEQKGIVARAWDISTQSRGKYFLVQRRGTAGICRFHCRCCGHDIEVRDLNLYDSLQQHAKLIDFLPFADVLRVESLCARCAGFSGIDA